MKGASNMAILEVKDLKVHFPIKGGILGRTVGHVKAVDGVSFEINEKQTLGLIGESGSGKSTIGKAILGLAPITSGTIHFNGEDITKLIRRNKTPYRKSVQMIFQDAYSSLNPRERVHDIIAEPLRNFTKMSKMEERKAVDELLAIVGMSNETAKKYPFEFSGGQRQRIGVARAIALKPKLIVCDEPVSALDLSIQAQVLNYLKDIQEELKIAYLFISHDMSVVKYMCKDLAIMHNSRFVEFGSADLIYENPVHIYTKRLIGAIPNINPREREKNKLLRAEILKEYTRDYKKYYAEDGSLYPLIKKAENHFVALPEGV